MGVPNVPFAPKVMSGALVQLIEDVVAFIPNVVTFQYNPEKITRALTPYDPNLSSGLSNQAPDSQPFAPEEKISFTLNLMSNDEGIARVPGMAVTGVASRLAAMRKIVKPSTGLLGDLVGSAQALKKKTDGLIARTKVPITFLIYGPGLVVPVRITSFSVDEVMHTSLLYPQAATVTLALTVVTPDQFKCTKVKFADLAIAAYNFTQLQEDALAVANIANGVEDVLGMII